MKKFVLLLTFACISFIPSRAANIISFLKIPSIPGESLDEKHLGEIAVLTIQQNIDHAGTALPSATLAITKLVDRASPALAKATMTGKSLAQIILTVRKAGTDRLLDYYIVTLDNAVAVIVDQASNEGLLSETVTFSASKITWTYVPQKADGNAGDPVSETASVSRHSQ